MTGAAAAKAALAALPVRPFEAVFGDRPILVLAPHPDDESLGCGGLLAEAAARGVAAHVAFLTDGGGSHPNSHDWPRTRLIATRQREALAATAILGVPPARVTFLDAPDGEAPHDGALFAALADRLAATVEREGIGTVCATWIGDPHGDHGSAARLAAAAAARTGARHLAYPVWAWTVSDDGWLPQVTGGARLDIARHRDRKRRAIAAHATQHAGLITDDPTGFNLPADFLARFDGPWETFVEPP